MNAPVKTEEVPPELKSFHQRTMLILFAGTFIAFGLGFAGDWFHERNPEFSRTLGFAFGAVVLSLMAYMIHRAVYAKPSCPACRCRMEFKQRVVLPQNGRWRVFVCPSCRCEHRIPGLSRWTDRNVTMRLKRESARGGRSPASN